MSSSVQIVAVGRDHQASWSDCFHSRPPILQLTSSRTTRLIVRWLISPKPALPE